MLFRGPFFKVIEILDRVFIVNLCSLIISKVVIMVSKILRIQRELHSLYWRSKDFFCACDNIWNLILFGYRKEFDYDLDDFKRWVVIIIDYSNKVIVEEKFTPKSSLKVTYLKILKTTFLMFTWIWANFCAKRWYLWNKIWIWVFQVCNTYRFSYIDSTYLLLNLWVNYTRSNYKAIFNLISNLSRKNGIEYKITKWD